jgi:capsid protein
VVQNWMIDHVVKPIFSEWLEYALLSGSLKLPAAKVQKFNAAEWRARRWTWVDPLKDTNASILAIENGLKSRRRVIAEQGGDIEETLDEMREDRELAKSKGLAFPFPGKNGNGNGRALDLDSEQIEQESDE